MGTQATNVFDSLPKTDPLNFYQGGNVRYDKVRDFLKLDNNELSKISGVSKSSVRLDNRIPAQLEERMIEIATIATLVAEFFKGDVSKTYLWFNTPNPTLGNVSPRNMLRLGRYKRLYNFVTEARQANGKQEKN